MPWSRYQDAVNRIHGYHDYPEPAELDEPAPEVEVLRCVQCRELDEPCYRCDNRAKGLIE